MSKYILRCCHFMTNTFCELKDDKKKSTKNTLLMVPPIKHLTIGIEINACPITEPLTPQTVRLQHVHTYCQ